MDMLNNDVCMLPFQGLVLVTDAVPAMGLQAGTHTIGQQKVDVTENGAFIAGTNTLCGR